MSTERSFKARLAAGETKEQLMKYFAMSEDQYNRVLVCLERIKREKPKEALRPERIERVMNEK
jgi:hypothetical protein